MMLHRYIPGEGAEQMVTTFAPLDSVLLRFTPTKVSKVR